MKTLRIFSFFVIGMSTAGCMTTQVLPTVTVSPTPIHTTTTPTPVLGLPEGKIIFEQPGTQKFAGTVHGQGKTAIIMANMGSGGETQWDPFIEAVDKQKFTTITFNYLQPDYTIAAQEMNIILQKLKASGYARVICIGASLGVTSCGSLARAPEIVGLVMIAGPNNSGSLAKATYPKLFIAGALDQWAHDTQIIYKEAAEPKKLVLFEENSVHGANLFYSKDRDQFLKLLIDFVNDLTNP